MDSQEYSKLARRLIDRSLPAEQQMLNAALGLAGESGEIADLVKKYHFHGHTNEVDKIVLELGDLLWYVQQMCYALNVTMHDVMIRNIDKLERRYPNGFNYTDSLNRKD